MDLSDHVRHSPHAGQDLHCNVLPTSLPDGSLPSYHVHSQCCHSRCMDLQYPRHHLPVQSCARSMGFHSDEELLADRQVLLLYNIFLNLYRFLAVHTTPSSVLETEAPS